MDDRQLLGRYLADGSEDAFRELMRRHMAMVYSAALRQVRDPQLAQDVTQVVFTNLARKARSIPTGTVLAGWLHRDTRYTALDLLRSESRRTRREQQAAAMNVPDSEPAPNWAQIRPLLDEVLDQLRPEDRDALLLRYFQERNFAEVGTALGASSEAARKRVDRALDRLREQLVKRGISTTATALGVALSAHAIEAVPPGFATALAGSMASTSAAIAVTQTIAMTTLQKTLIAVTAVGMATALVVQHRSQVSLRDANQSLRQQLAQLQADKEALSSQVAQLKIAPASLAPWPTAVATVATNPPDARSPYERVTEFLDSHRELSREQIEAYLRQNHRNVESLLAAFQVSHDPAYLREAATNAPNEPVVQFAVIANDIFPDEQRKWIDAFKASSPDNALPWYLSAQDYFKAQQPDQAITELTQATRRQLYGAYAAQTVQAVEEMCAAAGWPALAAEAAAPGTAAASGSYLAVLRSLAGETVQTQQQYLSQGDARSAASMASMGIVLGDQLRRSSLLIDQLVGISIEKKIVGQLDPAENYGFLGRPVSQALAELDQQKQAIQDLVRTRDQIRPTLNESELKDYWEREKLYGEVYAMQWLQWRYGQH